MEGSAHTATGRVLLGTIISERDCESLTASVGETLLMDAQAGISVRVSGGEGLDRPSCQAFIVHSGAFFDYYYAFPKALAKIAVKGDKKVVAVAPKPFAKWSEGMPSGHQLQQF